MKVECPNCKGRGILEYGGSSIECVNCGASGEFNVEIPTADLIAELERRRPCKRCEFKLDEYCECCWDGLNSKQDNFKEAK